MAGFKYFRFDGSEQTIALDLRGHGSVCIRLDSPNGAPVALLTHTSNEWTSTDAALAKTAGIHALYITVAGGTLDLGGFVIA